MDKIDCKIKGLSMAFPFISSIFNKSIIVGNITIFKNLNIHQLGLIKEDP